MYAAADKKANDKELMSEINELLATQNDPQCDDQVSDSDRQGNLFRMSQRYMQ